MSPNFKVVGKTQAVLNTLKFETLYACIRPFSQMQSHHMDLPSVIRSVCRPAQKVFKEPGK